MHWFITSTTQIQRFITRIPEMTKQSELLSSIDVCLAWLSVVSLYVNIQFFKIVEDAQKTPIVLWRRQINYTRSLLYLCYNYNIVICNTVLKQRGEILCTKHLHVLLNISSNADSDKIFFTVLPYWAELDEKLSSCAWNTFLTLF